MRRILAAVGVSVLCALGAAAPAGCAGAKIAALESMGYAKREQLVGRVQDAKEGQEAAKAQFESALAEFLAVTGASDSAKVAELEGRYSKLRGSYEKSESRAETVRSRIKDVERVADALFKEWNAELAQYSSSALREASERQLNDTRRQYDRLLAAMLQASSKMDPVLAAFKDQVLFLKHNLNARAIASLKGTATKIESDVGSLVREMEASIAEANAFIGAMGDPAGG